MKSKYTLLIVLCVLAITIVACNVATTSASCSYIVGVGHSGYDANIHKIVYPGQEVYAGDGETAWYVPCNSRNYIINDGSVINANSVRVGDRAQLIEATTNTGIPITIAARALWTLNQSDQAMKDFYNVCFKYQCASSDDLGGEVNFATNGWNGMLAENFGPAMDAAARIAATKVDDTIWEIHDPAQYQLLADQMSAIFADTIRANLGYTEDLFCGSGNSTWEDVNRPGSGTFTCSPVRIIVDEVQRGEVQADETTEGALSINRQRLQNAEALYGESAWYWLGLQDTIEACIAAGTRCNFFIGDVNSVPVEQQIRP